MKNTTLVTLVALLAVGAGAVGAQDIKKPEPTVPEIFTLTGEFVRIAYNNEGYVTLGYRVANDSVAEDWMLLEIGVTLRAPTKAQTMTRDSLSLMLPDGSTIGLATQKEFAEAGHLPALNTRGNMVRDSINYFPVNVDKPCVIGFFSDPTNRVRSLSFDQVELSSNRACMGRVFFKVPGQIQTGQHYLLVKFDNSMIEVPFRILTKAEEKEFRKNWKSLKKEHDAENKQ
ncbi:MAG: hypothetical protein OEV48_05880 [Acidobacteriota bacterium]|jgi:hypothetical protein|nr:hypothetical protein [Acidobacteriota bacterium]